MKKQNMSKKNIDLDNTITTSQGVINAPKDFGSLAEGLKCAIGVPPFVGFALLMPCAFTHLTVSTTAVQIGTGLLLGTCIPLSLAGVVLDKINSHRIEKHQQMLDGISIEQQSQKNHTKRKI